MRENAAYYKQFIEVHPGGGTRRNPKRKNAGGFSTRLSNFPPTAEDIDQTFENHLRKMARGGTYGDNMEIAAFSSAFHVDVKIYQRNFAYVVSARAGGGATDGSANPVVHIAHHVSYPLAAVWDEQVWWCFDRHGNTSHQFETLRVLILDFPR